MIFTIQEQARPISKIKSFGWKISDGNWRQQISRIRTYQHRTWIRSKQNLKSSMINIQGVAGSSDFIRVKSAPVLMYGSWSGRILWLYHKNLIDGIYVFFRVFRTFLLRVGSKLLVVVSNFLKWPTPWNTHVADVAPSRICFKTLAVIYSCSPPVSLPKKIGSTKSSLPMKTMKFEWLSASSVT